MTLLELLKVHLWEWPEDVRAYSQDSDGSINENLHTHPMPWGTAEPTVFGWSWPSGDWYYADDPLNRYEYWKLQVADDAYVAIVTREMWEAAQK